jgi:uncharacterized membrane protein
VSELQFFMLMAHRTGDAATIAVVARIIVIADLVFTATAVVIQPITGILLARTIGIPLFTGWINVSFVLCLVAGVFWVPVVLRQKEMSNLANKARAAGALPPTVRLFRIWFVFGFPAFGAVLTVIWP